MESINEVINERDREMILLGDLVQGMIVDAHSQFPIFFLDKDDWCAIRRFTWFDGSCLDKLIDFSSHGI